MKQPTAYPGKLFVFEGLDGSGKSSLLKGVVAELRLRFPQQTFLSSKEPGGTALGDKIRELLLHPVSTDQAPPTAMAEALLFNAARAQLIEEFIRPNLKRGAWIFLDRFTLSTYAYQGASSSIDLKFLSELTERATQNLIPDLTIFLNAPLALCKARLNRSRRRLDRIEQLSYAFFQHVHQRYNEALKEFPHPLLLLDATRSKKRLLSETLQALLSQESVCLSAPLCSASGGALK